MTNPDRQAKVTGPPVPVPVDIDPVATGFGNQIDGEDDENNENEG